MPFSFLSLSLFLFSLSFFHLALFPAVVFFFLGRFCAPAFFLSLSWFRLLDMSNQHLSGGPTETRPSAHLNQRADPGWRQIHSSWLFRARRRCSGQIGGPPRSVTALSHRSESEKCADPQLHVFVVFCFVRHPWGGGGLSAPPQPVFPDQPLAPPRALKAGCWTRAAVGLSESIECAPPEGRQGKARGRVKFRVPAPAPTV